ncbi:LysR substrate-binding domain-containing protein [Enterovirga rhinocerotis]|nr:LysR substrate-binding domain-containing protein [Enterovirga rhinocerotis]
MPPLNPLHVFEVAARVGGFGKAAAELNVTQSAVSRQIAVLEDFLGMRLFHRERAGATLTEAGLAYAADISEPFARIAAATARLSDAKTSEAIHVRAYATFSAKWLIPRLTAFKTRYPRTNIRVSSIVKAVDFSRETVDVAIQLGRGGWPGTESALLFPDLLQPVASPDVARALVGEPPEALARQTLLHSYYRRRDWDDWLGAAGVESLDASRGMVFESSVLTYQAAAEGLGIAIGQPTLLDAEIRAGRLVPLYGPPVRRDLGYYAVWPSDRRLPRRVETFIRWLEQEAKASEPVPV